MAPTPEEIQFQHSLDILTHASFLGMDPDMRDELSSTLNRVKEEYAEARALATKEGATAEEAAYGLAVGNAIAKSLPDIAKGALAAAKAFQSGDNMAGSAAILDICAAVIPVFSAVLGATGPQGAVFGALFSVVGQLLAFFAPPKPSLTDQIKTMLDRIEANQQLADMKGVHSAINVYASQLEQTRHDITEILGGRGPKGEKIDAMPLTNDNAHHIQASLEALKLGVIDATGQLNAAAFETWKVGGWLRIEDNQGNERWPEVLGVWCRAYADLMTANMRVNCLANPKRVAELRMATDKANLASPITDRSKRHDVNQAVINDLEAILIFLRKKFSSWHAEVLRILNETQQAARDRGLYTGVGFDQCLYVAAGRKGNLPWEYKKNTGWMKRIYITVPKEYAGSLTPRYEAFLCETGGVSRHMLDPTNGAFEDGPKVSDRLFADICALPAPVTPNEPNYGPKPYFIYGVHDEGSTDKVELFSLDGNNKWTQISWTPAVKSGIVNYRAVTLPPVPLLDDPDKDAMADNSANPPGPPLLAGVDHYVSIHYGALRSSPEIYVNVWNAVGYVPSPWPAYSGIEVDPYFVWVFQPYGFACATHSSIVKCRQRINAGQADARPRWIVHGLAPNPNVVGPPLGDVSAGGENNYWRVLGREVKGKPPVKGLISLCPSMDGTLTASIYSREVRKWSTGDHWLFEAKDTPDVYTTDYNVDLKALAIRVGAWTKRTGGLSQVHKMPIPCWTLYESLKHDLQIARARAAG